MQLPKEYVSLKPSSHHVCTSIILTQRTIFFPCSIEARLDHLNIFLSTKIENRTLVVWFFCANDFYANHQRYPTIGHYKKDKMPNHQCCSRSNGSSTVLLKLWKMHEKKETKRVQHDSRQAKITTLIIAYQWQYIMLLYYRYKIHES